MEQAAFDSQMAKADVQELGRMTINFGYLELLLDWLIGPAFELQDHEVMRELISPLNLDRKIKLLRSRLDRCRDENARAMMVEALALISTIKDDRNTVTHGYWAFEKSKGATVFNRKREPKPAQIRSISEIADTAALASRLLYDAFLILNGRDPERSAPDVLLPQSDGTFTFVRRQAGLDWPDSTATVSIRYDW